VRKIKHCELAMLWLKEKIKLPVFQLEKAWVRFRIRIGIVGISIRIRICINWKFGSGSASI
jgi:hypothetical protein